jgi:hypothetical protein
LTPVPNRGFSSDTAAHRSRPHRAKKEIIDLSSSSSSDDDEDGEEDDETWFCHQHRKALLSEVGFYLPNPSSSSSSSSKNNNQTWIEFSSWIPPSLSPDTRAALIVEMERRTGTGARAGAGGAGRERGFVYVFEYRGLATRDHRVFKIGYSKNVVGRLSEWGRRE